MRDHEGHALVADRHDADRTDFRAGRFNQRREGDLVGRFVRREVGEHRLQRLRTGSDWRSRAGCSRSAPDRGRSSVSAIRSCTIGVFTSSGVPGTTRRRSGGSGVSGMAVHSAMRSSTLCPSRSAGACRTSGSARPRCPAAPAAPARRTASARHHGAEARRDVEQRGELGDHLLGAPLVPTDLKIRDAYRMWIKGVWRQRSAAAFAHGMPAGRREWVEKCRGIAGSRYCGESRHERLPWGRLFSELREPSGQAGKVQACGPGSVLLRGKRERWESGHREHPLHRAQTTFVHARRTITFSRPRAAHGYSFCVFVHARMMKTNSPRPCSARSPHCWTAWSSPTPFASKRRVPRSFSTRTLPYRHAQKPRVQVV